MPMERLPMDCLSRHAVTSKNAAVMPCRLIHGRHGLKVCRHAVQMERLPPSCRHVQKCRRHGLLMERLPMDCLSRPADGSSAAVMVCRHTVPPSWYAVRMCRLIHGRYSGRWSVCRRHGMPMERLTPCDGSSCLV
jgi:hypothetical protein